MTRFNEGSLNYAFFLQLAAYLSRVGGYQRQAGIAASDIAASDAEN